MILRRATSAVFHATRTSFLRPGIYLLPHRSMAGKMRTRPSIENTLEKLSNDQKKQIIATINSIGPNQEELANRFSLTHEQGSSLKRYLSEQPDGAMDSLEHLANADEEILGKICLAHHQETETK